MAKISINEALGWKKTLTQRHAELVRLRDSNSVMQRTYRGDKEVDTTPLYDAKELDKTITVLAREIRLVDVAVKRANAKTILEEYDQDDKVLGELA